MAKRVKPTPWISFKRVLIGVILLAFAGVGLIWLLTALFETTGVPRARMPGQYDGVHLFDYTVTVDGGRIRINGTADLANGVLLTGRLDKIGHGSLEVKEALVISRIFGIEFELPSHMQYPWIGEVETLAAGLYRITVEFDPSQQSPFAYESLMRGTSSRHVLLKGDAVRQLDPGMIRLAQTFAIGTPEEQQHAAAREHQHRQTIRRHLLLTLSSLQGLWQRLQGHYQQERLGGPFSPPDPRADAWQIWSAQWLSELRSIGEEHRLHETVAAMSPYRSLWEMLVTLHKKLAILPGLYYEVVSNVRPLHDRELQHAERQVHLILGDALTQLGQPGTPSVSIRAGTVKSTVIVTSPFVNIRSGPGMSHEVVTRARKDEVLDFLGEQGEWLQVWLQEGRSGWVHRNVASKQVSPESMGAESKPNESRVNLQLAPIPLNSTPMDYIPRPTQDEFKVYAELESQLREISSAPTGDRHSQEQHILQRLSDKYKISPELVWTTYLKVQAWEIIQ